MVSVGSVCAAAEAREFACAQRLPQVLRGRKPSARCSSLELRMPRCRACSKCSTRAPMLATCCAHVSRFLEGVRCLQPACGRRRRARRYGLRSPLPFLCPFPLSGRRRRIPRDVIPRDRQEGSA